MSEELEPDVAHELITKFCDEAKAELNARWTNWKLDYSQVEVHEVVGALLARQVTLATSLARSPSLWNWSMAPNILRPMTEVYLNLKWIFADPPNRSCAFIAYGLGQMKLRLEQLKAISAGNDEKPPNSVEESLESMQTWIDSQLYSSLVEVNLGKWAENQRHMAEEVDEIEFYNHCYAPYSAGVHSMWHHVGVHNVKKCTNPLHRFHKIPNVPDLGSDVYFVVLAAKYQHMVFELFDFKTNVKSGVPSAFQNLIERISKIRSSKT
jgi:Family of unknown function (DUF5677)